MGKSEALAWSRADRRDPHRWYDRCWGGSAPTAACNARAPRAELLPVLGRYQQALDESAALLAASPPPERRAELHRLRADVYRALGDAAQAQREATRARSEAR